MKKKILIMLSLILLATSLVCANSGGRTIYVTVGYTDHNDVDDKDVVIPEDGDGTTGTSKKTGEPIHQTSGGWKTDKKYPKTRRVAVWVPGPSEKDFKDAVDNFIETMENDSDSVGGAESSTTTNNSSPGEGEAVNRVIEIESTDLTASEQQYIVDSINQGNTGYSAVKGDPVRIATGEFITNRDDISVGEIVINRGFRSDQSYDSLFGNGFYSNIESRIIRGVRFNSDSELESIKRQHSGESTKSTNLYSAYNVSLTNISELEEKVKKQNDILYNGIVGLRSAKAKQPTRSRKDQIQKMIDEEYPKYRLVNEKYLEIKTARENLEKSLSSIDAHKELVDSIKEKLDFAENQNKLTHVNQYLNQYTYTANSPVYLDSLGLDTITYVDEDSMPHTFTLTTKPDYGSTIKIPGTNLINYYPNGSETIAEPDSKLKLRLFSNGELIITKKDNSTMLFNIYGQLKKTETINKKTLDYIYGTNQTLTEIVDERGRSVKFGINNRKISSITDPKGNTVYYSYDSLNRLISVVNRLGYETRYEYDGTSSRFNKIIKPDNSFRKYIYELINGKYRVTSTVDEEGNTEFFDYDLNGKKTTYTNPAGVKTVHHYDNTYKEVRVENIDGSYEYSRYNSLTGNKESFIDVLNNNYNYIYDDNHNVTNTTFSDSSNESRIYDNNNLLLSIEDRDNRSFSYSYNADKTIRDITEQNGDITSFTYDDKGRVLTVKKVNGSVTLSITEINYNESFDNGLGVIKRITDGENKVVYHCFDRMGLLKEVRHSSNKAIYTFEYDAEGNLIKKNYLLDNSAEEYIYSNRKDLIYSKERTGVQTLFRYDRSHNLKNRYILQLGTELTPKEILDPNFVPQDGKIVNKVSFEYRGDGKLTKKTVGDRQTTVYRYNSRGWLDISILKEAKEATKYLYDAAGRVTEKVKYYNYRDGFTDHLETAVVINYEYDTNNNISKIIYSDNSYEEFKYNSVGELLTKTSRVNSDFITDIKRYKSSKEEYVIDDFGPLSYVKQDGNRILKGQSNTYGELITETYNKNGQVISVEYPDGGVEKFTYNSEGLLETKTDLRGAGWIYEYNLEGKVEKLYLNVKFDKTLYRTYFYENGQLSHYKDSKTKSDYTEKYEYNEFGKIKKKYNANKNSINYRYNDLGQLAEYSDYAGNLWLTEYNPNGTIKSKTDPLKSKVDYQYTYSDKGKEVVVKRNSMLVSKNYYDKMGRIVKTIDGDNITTTYGYDKNGNKTYEKTGYNNPYTWVYDERSRIVEEKNHNNKVKRYSYNRKGLLENVYEFGEISPIKYSYDRYNRLDTISYPDGSNKEFNYSVAGDLIEVKTDSETLTFSYNELGQLEESRNSLTKDIVTYKYDLEGNMTEIKVNGELKTSYKYNSLNSVEEVNTGTRTIKFSYDINGREVLRTSKDDTTTKIYDKVGRILSIKHNDGWEIARAEAYRYNDMGQKSHMIDERGNITTFNYTNGGRLKEVNYPLLDDFIETSETEYRSLGILVDDDDLDIDDNEWDDWNKTSPFSYEMEAKLRDTFKPITRNWQPDPKFKKDRWTESYSYDDAGNRINKSTLFGEIDYSYDNNRLVKAGNKEFSYDHRGNLTRESVLGITKSYGYSYDNRVTKFEDEFKKVNYSYDGLGRRSTRNELVKKEFDDVEDMNNFEDIDEDLTEATLPYDDDDYQISNIYMYEGISFNIAKEYIGHRYKLGELKGYIKNETHFNNNYENYDDDDDWDDEDVDEYSDVQVLQNSYLGRSVLTTKDHRWYNSKELYYLNDSLGSVIGVERYGTVRPIRYNAFGEDINEYEGPGFFGYNGKQFDRITQTYSYGYRDYSPIQGRFTTVDPIKDGNNWMVYVNSDPINFIDAFGLCVERKKEDIKTMQDGQWLGYRTYIDDSGLYSGGYGIRQYLKVDGDSVKYEYYDYDYTRQPPSSDQRAIESSIESESVDASAAVVTIEVFNKNNDGDIDVTEYIIPNITISGPVTQDPDFSLGSSEYSEDSISPDEEGIDTMTATDRIIINVPITEDTIGVTSSIDLGIGGINMRDLGVLNE